MRILIEFGTEKNRYKKLPDFVSVPEDEILKGSDLVLLLRLSNGFGLKSIFVTKKDVIK